LEAVIASLADTSKNQMFRYQTVEALSECRVKSDRARKFLEKLAAEEGSQLAHAAQQRLQVLDWKKKRYRPPETTPAPGSASEKELLESLRSNPNNYETATKLAKCSSDSEKEAVAILLKALREKRVMFPSNAISMIGLFGPEAKYALPFLLDYAGSDESGPANNAMAAIGEIGPDAIEAKPVVEKALLDPSPLLRWRAANTLCLIDPTNLNQHLQSLTSTLKADGDFSDFAIQSIGKFGAGAAHAAPFLTELLKNEAVRLAAGEALLKVQPASGETIARAVAADLKSDSVHVQDRAAKLLAEIGPPARDALPALREAATGSDVELAKLAQEAIAKIETK
jgi:HEAT repeat protein